VVKQSPSMAKTGNASPDGLVPGAAARSSGLLWRLESNDDLLEVRRSRTTLSAEGVSFPRPW
jgi:hypothetical protein